MSSSTHSSSTPPPSSRDDGNGNDLVKMNNPSSPYLLHRRTPVAARRMIFGAWTPGSLDLGQPQPQLQLQHPQPPRELFPDQHQQDQHQRPTSMRDLMNQQDNNNNNNNNNNNILFDNEQQYSSPTGKRPRAGSMRRRSSYDVMSASPYSNNNNNHHSNASSPIPNSSRRPVLGRRATGGMGDASDRSEASTYQHQQHQATNTPPVQQRRLIQRVGSGLANTSSRGGTPSSSHRGMPAMDHSSRSFSLESLPSIPNILQFGADHASSTPLRSSSTSSARRTSFSNNNSSMDGSFSEHYQSSSSVYAVHAQSSASLRGSKRRVRSRRGLLWRWNSMGRTTGGGSGGGAAAAAAGFRCRAACDLPVRDTLICLVFLMACSAGLFVGFMFVIVKGKSHTGGIYTPLIQSRTHAPPWHGRKHTPVTVFYNVFVARDPFLAGVDRLIVEEQLGQVGTSFAASAGDLHVYYTSIGDTIEQDWIQSLCTLKYNMTCIQTQHYRNANEDVTLAKLYHYCERHPDHSVVYLHNKGSLHPRNKGQDRWRRTMTAAATSQLCLEAPLSTSNHVQCNACGMLFQPLPAPHFPGNIFSAKCYYINQLLSPEEYHARNAVTDTWIKSEMEVGLIQTKFSGLFPMEAHYTGKRRYESEHWLGSHPDLRPCDVSVEANKNYWLEQDRDFAKEFSLAMAPRHNISANWLWWSYTSKNATLADPVARLRDYFLLRGILYRSLAFYNKIPERNSWVWKWFPDADMWGMAIDKFGGPAVAINALVQLPGEAQFVYPIPNMRQKWWHALKSVCSFLFAGGSFSAGPKMTNAFSRRVGDDAADDEV